MKIPILTLKETLDSLLLWTTTNYNSKTDKTLTWLYDTFNGNTHGNFNYYNEIVQLLTRGVDVPNKLETRLMYDTSRASLPTIHIHLPNESVGNFNSMGSGFEGAELYSLIDGEVKSGYYKSFDSTYDLIITGGNSEEIIAIYELLKCLFIAGASTLSNKFEVFNYSGKELMINPDLIPYNIFYRAFSVNIKFKQTVRSIESYPVIGEVNLSGKLVNE